jgi:hypothetical protein
MGAHDMHHRGSLYYKKVKGKAVFLFEWGKEVGSVHS